MSDDERLLKRIEQLEEEVARLRADVTRLEGGDTAVETLGHIDLSPPSSQAEATPDRGRPHVGKTPSDQAQSRPLGRPPHAGKSWLGVAGGALFFLGMIFVYRFSVEQGLLTPFMRIVIGYVTGATLFLAGITLRPRSRGYGVTLQGTGLALLYATSYAATFFYQLVTRDIAFALMDLVSLVAVTASVKQKEQAIAVAGLLAALATPFLLGSDKPDPGSLALYAAGIALVASIVHYRTGWRIVMGVITVAGWATIASCFAMQFSVIWSAEGMEPSVQIAMTALLAFLWGVPLYRTISHDDERSDAWIGIAAIANGFPFFIGSVVVWDWGNGTTTLASFGMAALYFGAAWLLSDRGKKGGILSLHLIAGHLMVLIGLALGADVLTDEQVWASALWALYAAGLVFYGVKRTRHPMVIGGLIILGVTAAKLILFDFSQGSLLIRAVVFLGVGGLALGMNYWLLPHLRDKDEEK